MSYVARADDRLSEWLKRQSPSVPNLDACWRAALTKLEQNPDVGTALAGGELRGVQFPAPADIEKNKALGMFPRLLIAYSVAGSAITVHEVKIKT